MAGRAGTAYRKYKRPFPSIPLVLNSLIPTFKLRFSDDCSTNPASPDKKTSLDHLIPVNSCTQAQLNPCRLYESDGKLNKRVSGQGLQDRFLYNYFFVTTINYAHRVGRAKKQAEPGKTPGELRIGSVCIR